MTALASKPPASVAEHRTPAPRAQPPATGWSVTAAVACHGAALVAALVADGRPTGIDTADAAWRCVLALVVVALWCDAPPLLRTVVAGALAVASVPSAFSTPAALAAAFVSLAAASLPPGAPGRRLSGRASGALVAAALLHLGHPDETIAVVALGALVVVPAALATTRWGATRRRRRVIGLVSAAAVVVVVVATGLAAYTGLRASAAVADGTAAAQTANDALGDGDGEAARQAFAAASDRFAEAASTLESRWLLPARIVPGLGQNVGAATAVTRSGAALAATAATTLDAIDVGELTVAGGAVPLDALEDAAGPMADAHASLLEQSAVLGGLERSLLLPPARRGLARLTDAIADIEPTVATLALATDRLPAALGAAGGTRWLVLLGTPAESRFAGGFIGSWALLTANDGLLAITESGPISDLNPQRGSTPAPITSPEDYALRWNERYHPELFFQNVTASAHFPSVGAVADELWSRSGRPPLDGVVYLDPQALAALVGLLDEPVTAPDGTLLDGTTTAPYLLSEQYLAFADDLTERREMLAGVMTSAAISLTTSELPSIAEIADHLADPARQGRIMIAAFDPGTDELVRHAQLDGALVPEEAEGVDVVSLRSANASANKIDTFVHRSLRWSAEVTEDRTLLVDGEITVTNRAPAEGLPDYVIGNEVDDPVGSVTTLVSLHTRHRLVGSSIDGTTATLEQRTEAGLFAYTAIVTIPAGSSSTIRFNLAGDGPIGDDYELLVVGQPTANPDHVVVTLDGEDDWRAVGVDGGDAVLGDRAAVMTDPGADRLVTARFEAR